MFRYIALAVGVVFARSSAALFCGPGTVMDSELGGCVVAPDRSFRSTNVGPSMDTDAGNLLLRVDEGKEISVQIGQDKYSLNPSSLEPRFEELQDGLAANADSDNAVKAELAESVRTSIANVVEETDTKLVALQNSIEQDLQPTINALKADFDATKIALSKEVDDLASTTGASIANLKETVSDDVQVKLAASEKKVEEQAKVIADNIKKLDYVDKVIELNSKTKEVSTSKTNVVMLNKKYPAPRHHNYGSAMPDGRGWSLPEAGTYWVTYTMRTFHLDSQWGFTKVRLYDDTKKQALAHTTTMISEFGGASYWRETQKTASGFHKVDVSGKTQLSLIAWHNCNSNNQRCGWINDANGFGEFIYVKINTPSQISYRWATGGAMIRSGGWHNWQTGNNRWNLPNTGKYLLFYTLRTYQRSGGFGKLRLANNRAGAVPYSERMITEWSGSMRFVFTNHVASGVHLYDNKHANSYMYSQYYATGGGIGWQSDSNGHNHFVAVEVGKGKCGFKNQNNKDGNSGRKDYPTSKFGYLKGYDWELPNAGTYILFATIRNYHSKRGKAQVMLNVVTAEDGAELKVPDHGGVKYGSTVRMQEFWDRPAFSFTNHISTWSWQVEVTGKMTIGLHGKAESGGIGLQNDGNGWSSTIWWQPPTTETEATLLLPKKD